MSYDVEQKRFNYYFTNNGSVFLSFESYIYTPGILT